MASLVDLGEQSIVLSQPLRDLMLQEEGVPYS